MKTKEIIKCGKCEMLGDSAPCDECYRNNDRSLLWTSPCDCNPDEKTGETLCCNLCGRPSARTESKELPGEVIESEFAKVGDEGLFPNHTDKDIWVKGFNAGYTYASPLLASKDARIRELEEELERLVSIIENGIDAEEDKFLGDCGS